MQGSYAVHLRVQQNVYEHLDLGKFLPKKGRHSCVGQRHGELIKAELKFIRKFYVVSLGPAKRGNCRLTQTRLKFVGRQRWRRDDAVF